jgi:mRNA-degrading endonuclease YafQ of YafQ-DinJ toxin-antitoxin module
MSYQIVFGQGFEKKFKKLIKNNLAYKIKIQKTLKILNKNINHLSLRLHKLTSKNYWSISIDRDLRIIFYFQKNIIFLLDIGNHDEVY